jgi:hypothetical protein
MRSIILQNYFGNNGMKAYTANKKEKLTTMQILDPLSSYSIIRLLYIVFHVLNNSTVYTQHGNTIMWANDFTNKNSPCRGKTASMALHLRRSFLHAGRETPQRPAALDVPPSAQDTCLRPCASCWKRVRWLYARVHDSNHSDGGLSFDPDVFKFAPRGELNPGPRVLLESS